MSAETPTDRNPLPPERGSFDADGRFWPEEEEYLPGYWRGRDFDRVPHEDLQGK